MMKYEREYSFEIVIVQSVSLTATKVKLGDGTTFYEVTKDGIIYGKLFPTVENPPYIIWKTKDDIHPIFVSQIGLAIEKYYQ